MKHHHSHLPDPFKVSKVSKIFEEWSSDNTYKLPHIKTRGYEKHFSPKDEIEQLQILLAEKDRHFFQKAYKSYLKYITAHEKGVLVQNQETLKALSCFRQMILSRASSQRFTKLFERLSKVQTNGSHHKKKKSSSTKPRLPVPSNDAILNIQNENKDDKKEEKEIKPKDEEKEKTKELTTDTLSESDKKRKHSHKKPKDDEKLIENIKEEKQEEKTKTFTEVKSGSFLKSPAKHILDSDNADIDDDIDLDDEDDDDIQVNKQIKDSPKQMKILDSEDETALLSPLIESSSAKSADNEQQSSKSGASKPSYSVSDNQRSDYDSEKINSKDKEQEQDRIDSINSNSNTENTDEIDEDDGTPLQQYISLLKRQTNGLINSDILQIIYDQLEIYRPILEDSCKENIPILEEYKNQIEAGFFPIESIQNLAFMLKSISSKVVR